MPLREISGKDPSYQFLQVIGSGGFGSVSKVRRVKDGRIMACKTIDCSAFPELEKLASREIATWASFGGTEKYIAVYSDDSSWNSSSKTIRIYMNFYEGGDLQRVIDTCRHEDITIHPMVATYWALEIARGIKACHDHGIIHRDIKPQNILLKIPYVHNDALWAATQSNAQSLPSEYRDAADEFLTWMQDRTPWCHLTDFGLGKFSAGALLSRQSIGSYGMVGTPGFVAPESLGDNATYSSKSDVYSFGCLLYALCQCSALPSLTVPYPVIPSIQNHYPRRLQSLIELCLKTDPSQRPTSREVVNELSEVYVDFITSDSWTKTKTTLSLVNPQQASPAISSITAPMRQLAVDDKAFVPSGSPQVLEGHSSQLKMLKFSPNGKFLASASYDSTIRIWDAQTGMALNTLLGHTEPIFDIVFSLDSARLVSGAGGSSNNLRIWDVQFGTAPRVLEGHKHNVEAVAISADGKYIASGSHDRTVRIWDGDTGAFRRALANHYSLVTGVAFSIDGSVVATAMYDGTVCLWKHQTGTLLKKHDTGGSTYIPVIFSPDRKTLISTANRSVNLYDLTGNQIKSWTTHEKTIFSLAVSSDGKRYVSGSDDKTVILWSHEIGALSILKGHTSYITSVAISPNGKTIASGSHDRTIKLWNHTGRLLKTLTGHEGYISSMAFSPDGKTLASCSTDDKVWLWR